MSEITITINRIFIYFIDFNRIILLDKKNNITYDQMIMQSNSSKKIAYIFSVFLFFLIVALSLYLFDLTPFNVNSTNDKSSNTTNNLENKEDNILPSKMLISPSTPITFTNTQESGWIYRPIKNNKIKVTSAIKVNTTMAVKFEKDSPNNSSVGIFITNELPAKDPNVRLISFYYYLPTKTWMIGYRSGSTTKYFGLNSKMEPNNVFGTFSLLLSADGKNIQITFPNQTTQSVDLPTSLYETTNQMSIKAQIGPKANLTISSLNYQTLSQ